MRAEARMEATPSDVAAAEAGAAPEVFAPSGRIVNRSFLGFDLGSVFRFGSAFYLSLAATWIVGSLVLFAAAKATGIAGNIEGFVRESGFDEFRMTWLGVLQALFVTGALAAILLTALTLLLAFLFNRVADVFGGIQTRVIQTEDPAEPAAGDSASLPGS